MININPLLQVGVIGYGYWGPNLVRNFTNLATTQVIALCDHNPNRLELATKRHPGIAYYTQPQDLFKNPQLDIIAIATPASSHYELALTALQHDKHVLVEKPLAMQSQQVQHLISEARKRQRVLLVDHTFVYTPAVQKLKTLIEAHTLGDLYYYDSVRVNLGLFQHDINVLWDLAVHDLSIIDYLFPVLPCAVSATGIRHIPSEPENLAYLTLFFPHQLIAHVHVNWLAPVKVRRTLIGGSQKMIVFDDLEPTEKIKLYDRGVNIVTDQESVYNMLISYRTGDMYAPHLETTEALSHELQHFTDCILQHATPLTGGESGYRVVTILEAAMRSMQERGQPIELVWNPEYTHARSPA